MYVGRSLALRAHRRRFAVLVLAACITAALVGKLVEGAFADPASPITVTKSASASTVASGAQLTYTIVIKNTGGAALKNLVLSDQINGIGTVQTPPALPQLTMTSTKGSCTQGGPNGNLVTCNGGAMAGGETWTVTIGGQVTAGSGTNLNNTASITGTKSAQNFTTLSNSVSTPVSGGSGGTLPDLTINKTGPTSVAPGAPMTYTLTVNNTGTANATNVRVVDTVPTGITSIGATGSSLFTCSVASQTVTCNGGAVNQGQNATITITGNAPATPTTITNTAVVDPNNTIPETNELNNTSALVNTTVGGPPAAPLLDIKKTDGSPAPGPWGTGAGPDPVNPGQKLTYKILVTNNATGNNARADDVVVTDATQGLEAASIVASQTIVNGSLGTTGGCVVSAPQVRCSIKSLNSGGTLAITISGTVVQSAGSSIFNTATVTGNVKNQGVSNTASEVTTVRPQYDLTITKADQPDPVCARSWPQVADRNLGVLGLAGPPDFLSPAGGAPTPLVAAPVCLGGLRYDFVVGNSGIANATGVVVRDPLPAGLILDSYASDAGFACSVDIANVVTCVNGSIPASSTKKIAFVLVAPPNVGSITNTVTVDPNNAIFEADETNNTATESTGVSTGIDLVVWKGDGGQNGVVDPPGGAPPLTEGFDPIATNGTDTYTIIVDNVGTQDSTGIKVRDTLPAGTKFLSATTDPTHGFTCTHDGSATGGNVTCVGGHVLGTASEFYDPPGVIPAGPGDDFATITIKVFVTPFVQPSMHNEVRVDPDNEIAEVNEQNNFAQDNTTVTVGNDDKGAFNQLTIAKTQTSPPGPASVATNGTLIYNLHVENKGTDPVSNVVVKDFLPAGTRFIEAKDTATGSAAFFCTHDGAAFGGVVTCTGGDFSGSLNTIPGVPTSRDITVKVFAPNAPGTINNLATVDPDNVVPEGNEFDNDSQISTTVTVGGNNMFNELNLTKTQTSPVGNVATSSVVEYELVVKNDGSDPAFQVVVRDTLPAGFNFISADDEAAGANAFQCTNAANVITCTSARLDPGAGAARKIKVKAFSATQPGNYTNQAVVDPNNTIPEGDETNNTAQATTKVVVGAGFVDLKVSKSGPAQVTPGSTITYTLTPQNIGSDPAFNVKLRDDLPAHTTFVSAVDTTADPDGAFSCSLVGASILCTGGTLDGTPADTIPGVPDTRTITIKVLAPTSIEGFAADQSNISLDIFNRAIIDPDNTIAESNETNNASASVKTIVQSAIDLTLEKQGPGSATQNDTTTYTITVKNEKKGPGGTGQTAFGVKIIDPLPVGLIPLNVEADPGNFACQVLENPVNTVSCLGDLEADQTVTITITAFVTLESGTLDNEACVDPDHTIAETNELNNCKHAIGQVTTKAPDLQLNKAADKGSVTAGDDLTYTLTVSNAGTGDTTGSVDVTDDLSLLPVTVTNIDPDAGWDCSASSGNVVSCTRPDLAAGASSHIRVKVTVGNPSAPFTNTANVSGGGTDSQPNNNEDSVTTSVGSGTPIDLVVVSLSDNPDPVNHGQTLTYTSVVTNTGTSGSGPGAIVRVVLPPDAGVVPASRVVAATNTFSCGANTTLDPSGKTFDCIGTFGATGSGTESTTITASMTVAAGAPPPTQLTTTVTADPGLVIAESDETNNSMSETTAVSGTVCGGSPCVDLFASATTGTPVVKAPGPAIYVATVTNVGTNPVPDVAWTIKFEFTGVGVFLPVSGPSGVVCLPLGPIATCSSDAGDPDGMDLAPGASVTFVVTATALAPATGIFTLTADSNGDIAELTDGNNVSIVPTVILPPGP